MSQINIKDMIYKANAEAEAEVATELKSEKKQHSWTLAIVLFLVMIFSVTWNFSGFTSGHKGPTETMLESGEKIGLMILSDSLISDMRQNGRLPDALVGPLSNILDVQYTKLNDTDFELVAKFNGQTMTLRHENNEDQITSRSSL